MPTLTTIKYSILQKVNYKLKEVVDLICINTDTYDELITSISRSEKLFSEKEAKNSLLTMAATQYVGIVE